ncbi:hypothetical protein B4145_3535 [Bacillus subtilis]|uniref:Uncharacterized protein n=1 Tax=Bacillus subtilis subsp. subtilis TaxID=135461 RepID=A0ABD3ZNB1_BACIU|nr:hypothetical protein B4067_3645 [Bacillus subtilis subsp. subtilis]KIN53748.1 hypothetical protein B4145_3535 [Bacillus subtilis]
MHEKFTTFSCAFFGLKYVFIIPAVYDYDVMSPNSTGR